MKLKNKNLIITGGAGFIGSHLADALVEDNNVLVLDDLSFGTEDNVPDSAELKEVDVRDYDSLNSSLGDPDIVFHLAASSTTRESSMGWKNIDFDREVNLVGTSNLLKACGGLESRPKVIFASTAAVYGDIQYTPIDEGHPTNPVSPYGIHKLASEKYMQAYNRERGLETAILRIFNVYGPRQPRYVMYDFLKKLSRNKDTLEVLGTGEQVRTYCYVGDAVEGMIDVAESAAGGAVYNLAGDSLISISELAELIVDLTGLDAEIEYTGESWEGDIKRLEADNTKIKRELGFQPEVSLEDGLQKLIDYFEEREEKIA